MQEKTLSFAIYNTRHAPRSSSMTGPAFSREFSDQSMASVILEVKEERDVVLNAVKPGVTAVRGLL